MSEGLNRVTLYGNLGADPELRHTKSGTAVLNLRLATNERYKQGEEWTERTEWHSVVLWGNRGEALSKFLRKGSSLIVEGSLRTSSYEKEGEKRYKTEVNARNVVLCGNGGGGNGGNGGGAPPAPSHDPDDDIGF